MSEKYYKIYELMEGVYSITNCVTCITLVVGDEKALVYDTGYGFADCAKVIRAITDKPLVIVNSHGHFDHIGGNHYFDSPAYISEKDTETLNRHQSVEYRRYGVNAVLKFARLLFWQKWIPKTLDKEEYAHEKPFDNFIYVEDGHIFELGSATLEVVEMPGHTPGSIALYCKEKSLMLVSDATNPSVYLFLPESMKLSVYIKSLRKALGKEFSQFVTGHIPKLLPRAEMENYLYIAENLDWENGKPKKHPLRPDVEIRKCTNKGMKFKNSQSHIVISIDKL